VKKPGLPLSALIVAVFLAAACAHGARKSPSSAAAPAPAAASAKTAEAPPAAAPARAAVAIPKGERRRLWAVVRSVDAAGGRLTVRDRRGKLRTLQVATKARLTKGGEHRRIGLADVRPGDRVTLSFVGDVAASVHVNVLARTLASAKTAGKAPVAR
jgi:hypothetical protein